MSEELKACPKCKSSDITIEHWDETRSYRGICRNCRYSPDWWLPTENDAARYWNHRPLEAALQAQVDRLTEVVAKMVAFGEIWEAEGTLSSTEAELFDAAREALEGGE